MSGVQTFYISLMNPISTLLSFMDIHRGTVPVAHESILDDMLFKNFNHVPYIKMILDEVFRGIFVDANDHWQVTGPSKYLAKYGVPEAEAEKISGDIYLELSNILSCHFPNVTASDLNRCEYAIVNDYDLFMTYTAP